MSNLPYNPSAGNGITDVDELYDYITKCPLCLLDHNFMESYGRILCRAPWKIHEYFMKTARDARISAEGVELAEGIEARALDFNTYLQKFSEYDKEGCTSDADGNIIIHVLNSSGKWEQKYLTQKHLLTLSNRATTKRTHANRNSI